MLSRPTNPRRAGTARFVAVLVLGLAGVLIGLVLMLGRDLEPAVDGTSSDVARAHEHAVLRPTDAVSSEEPGAAARRVVLPEDLARASFVDGIVEILDVDGLSVRVPDGELSLYYEEPGVSSAIDVELRGGRFRLPAEPGNVISTVPLWVGARCAFLDGAPQRVIPADGPLRLRYRIPPALALQVVEALTGTELGDVTVVDEIVEPRLAVGDEIIARNAASPIALDLFDDDVDLLVGAPGYAWQGVHVDPRGGGTVRVELELAGSIRVRIEDEAARLQGAIEVGVLSSPDDALARMPARSGLVELDGLAPGDYVVRLGSDTRAVLYDWCVAHVEVGRTTEVAFPAGVPGASYGLVQVKGLLALPMRVDTSDVTLELLPATDGYRRAEVTLEPHELVPTPEGLAFETVLRPGRYGWEIDGWGARGEFVLDLRPEQEVRLEVPPLGRVEFELVGVPPHEAERAFLTWCSPAAARPYGIYWFFEELGGDGRASFLAPLGPLELALNTPTFPAHAERIEVLLGGTRVARRLAPPTGLRVFVRDAKTGEPLDPWYTLVPLGHGGGVVGWGDPDDGADSWMFVNAPGRYRLIVDYVWGYVPPEPVDVEIAAGAMARVDLELKPAPMRRVR